MEQIFSNDTLHSVLDKLLRFEKWEAIIAIGIGLLYCFAGYRIIRATRIAYGVIFGFTFALALVTPFIENAWLKLAALLACGFAGGLAAEFLYYVVIFLTGAFAAVILTIPVVILVMPPANGIISLVGFVAGGVLVILFERPFVIILSAFAAAAVLVKGVFSLTGPVAEGVLQSAIPVAVWAVACGLGMLVQFTTTKRKPESAA